MANILDTIGDTVEKILDKNSRQQQINPTKNNGRTCLEAIGQLARYQQLMKNNWKQDAQYTKTLVNAEYQIQTEFKVK